MSIDNINRVQRTRKFNSVVQASSAHIAVMTAAMNPAIHQAHIAKYETALSALDNRQIAIEIDTKKFSGWPILRFFQTTDGEQEDLNGFALGINLFGGVVTEYRAPGPVESGLPALDIFRAWDPRFVKGPDFENTTLYMMQVSRFGNPLSRDTVLLRNGTVLPHGDLRQYLYGVCDLGLTGEYLTIGLSPANLSGAEIPGEVAKANQFWNSEGYLGESRQPWVNGNFGMQIQVPISAVGLEGATVFYQALKFHTAIGEAPPGFHTLFGGNGESSSITSAALTDGPKVFNKMQGELEPEVAYQPDKVIQDALTDGLDKLDKVHLGRHRAEIAYQAGHRLGLTTTGNSAMVFFAGIGQTEDAMLHFANPSQPRSIAVEAMNPVLRNRDGQAVIDPRMTSIGHEQRMTMQLAWATHPPEGA